MKRLFLVLFVIASGSLYSVSSAEVISSVIFDLEQLKGHKVGHRWHGSEKWSRFWCSNCYYDYEIEMRGEITDIDVDLKNDGWIEVNVLMEHIGADVEGWYQSPLTFCRTVGASEEMRVGWATARAFVKFIETPDPANIKMKLVIQSTKFGSFKLKSGRLSRSQELFITRVTNFAFSKVWKSWLGEKLAKLIAIRAAKALSDN